MLADANEWGEVAGRQAAAAPGIEDEQALRPGQGWARRIGLPGQAARTAPAPARHRRGRAGLRRASIRRGFRRRLLRRWPRVWRRLP